jgi:hypothetical protein
MGFVNKVECTNGLTNQVNHFVAPSVLPLPCSQWGMDAFSGPPTWWPWDVLRVH